MRHLAGEPARLVSDSRGALAMPSLLMMLVLTSLVFAISGIVQTLIGREGLQDAADAAALASAITEARGMNLLAFLNLVMAALIAVLIAIRLAQAFMVIAAAILTVMGFFSFGATGPLVAVVTEQAIHLQQVYNRAKDIILPTLEGIHRAEEAVSVVIPWVAVGSAALEVKNHQPGADGGLAIPGSLSLPVEPDEFSVLCEHGSEMVAELALFPLTPILPDAVLSPIKDAAGEMGKALSGFLCGDGSGEPPAHTEILEQRMPRPPGVELCESDPKGAACAQAEKYLKDAEPRPHTGNCPNNDCPSSHPYEVLARAARKQCSTSRSPRPKDYVWQEHQVTVTEALIGMHWQEVERKLTEPRLRGSKTSPCGSDGLIDDDWEESHERGGKPIPVCAEEPTIRPVSKEQRTLTFRQVTHVFSCTQEVTRTFPLADKKDALGKDGSKRSPHRVEKDLALGSEEFQLRSIVWGPAPGPGQSAQWTQVSRPKEKEPQTSQSILAGALAQLGQTTAHLNHLGVAQAEYYFDHDGTVDPKDYLWSLRWKARLVRVHLPESGEKEGNGRREEKRAQRTQESRGQHGGLHSKESGDVPNRDGLKPLGILGALDGLFIH